jgi:hypothetical protein
MASVLGAAARTEVVGVSTVVEADGGEVTMGSETGSTVEGGGVVACDPIVVLEAWGAARGRDAAHPAVPIVTSRIATTDA